MKAELKENLKALFCSFVDAIADQQTAQPPATIPTGNLPMKKYLTVKESAEYLGISTQSLYELKMKKKLPSFKPGGTGSKSGKVYFDIDDLNNYFLSGACKSQKQIDSEAEKDLSEM